MRLYWPLDKPVLLLPVENGVELAPLVFFTGGRLLVRRRFPFARGRIHRWVAVERHWFVTDDDLEVEIPPEALMSRAATFVESTESALHQPFPLSLCSGAIHVDQDADGWKLQLFCALLGEESENDRVVLQSEDMIFWQRKEVALSAGDAPHLLVPVPDFWVGDVGEATTYGPEQSFSLALLRRSRTSIFARDVPSLPVIRHDGAPAFTEAMARYRIFQRQFSPMEGEFSCPLAFRSAPGTWPEIRLLPAEGTAGDVTAQAFEVKALLRLPLKGTAQVSLGGFALNLTTEAITCGGYSVAPAVDAVGRVVLHFVANEKFLQVVGRSQVLLVAAGSQQQTPQEQVHPVTENIAHCHVPQRVIPRLELHCVGGELQTDNLEIFGLRAPRWSRKAAEILRQVSNKGALLYQSPHYRVFAHAVEDAAYGPPAAFAPDGRTVLSPQRVCEEFRWRDNGFGDMVRAVHRGDIWHPSFEAGRYPVLHSGIASVDAAYNIALDTFALNTDGRYALPGQQGMWGSGIFQGEGQGFGVWLRDSAHIAMRCGSLIDPAVARRTLLYTLQGGFDNGHDGPAMAIAGMWDYYLATGDITALFEAWPYLLEKVRQVDALYSEEQGLVHVPTATSNDCFEEPENGGHALGGESYYMLAYEGMAKMAALTRLASEAAERWRQRAATMRQNIQTRYWNASVGYFTSGPQGTPAYEQGLWETSGMESAVWSRFGIASPEQKQEVLRRLRKEALGEYGIQLYPCKEKTNHFTGSVWGVWQAGFADAAAACGDTALLEQLIFGQVRCALLNKTFYEVIDAQSGLAWRWPGQLWHAAGFLSLLYYGVLGMRYDEEGLYFASAIPATLKNLRLEGLRYRSARLDVQTAGAGTGHTLLLDGQPAGHIPPDLEGQHTVRLVL